MATKYEGLTTAQWANRIVEYNPGKFDKSLLIKHYTAQQLGKFQEGGNIQLAKGLKCEPKIDAKTPAKARRLRRMMRLSSSSPSRRRRVPLPVLGNHSRLRSSFARLQLRTASRLISTRVPGVCVRRSSRLPRRSLLMTTCTRMIRIWRVVMRMMSSVVV